MSGKRFDNVVVIGGGIAGLGAAAVFSKYAQEVVLLEKGQRLDYPAVRKSIPQGHHIHILLRAGQDRLDELFPGFSANLIAQGAARIQAGTGQRIYELGSWSPNMAVDLEFLGVSRPFLEQQMYRALEPIGNIRLLEKCTASELVTQGDTVTELIYQDAGGMTHRQVCDAVVDASGAGSRLWRQALKDQAAIMEEKHEIDIFYSTLIFKPKGTPRQPRENILLVPSSTQDLGASLIDIENGLTCVSLHGIGQHNIPETTEHWLYLARERLPNDDLWLRIRDMEPCTELKTMRRKHMQWLHFEKCLNNILSGYFPIGDVISQVNPIFGQGMTLALGHAVALDHALQSGLANIDDMRGHYLKAAADWSAKAWRKCRNYTAITTSSDEKLQLIQRLAKQKLEMSHSDPNLYQVIVRQSQMLS